MKRWCILACALVWVCGTAAAQEPARSRLVFACQPDNDLYDLLSSRGGNWMRFDTALEAVRYAPNESGVLVLADGYPETLTEISEDTIDLATTKKVRLYIEYPELIMGCMIFPPREAHAERVVVQSDLFGPTLPKGRIMSLQDFFFTPVNVKSSHLAVSRVAGFDLAAYPMPAYVSPVKPEATVFPLLYKFPIGNALIASSKLSQFVKGRYAPIDAWRSTWQTILEWVAQRKVVVPLWTPSVAASFLREEALPAEACAQAIRRGAQWYFNAKLLVHPAWQAKAAAASQKPEGIAPKPEAQCQPGDGTLGMLEGFVSRIDADGNQPVRYVFRADCMSESAMALACDFAVNKAEISRTVAGNLVDFVYKNSELSKGPRSDPKSPSFGLLGWSTSNALGVYYGDDNARCMLGAIATGALIKGNQWEEPVLRCLLANLRTTGSLGFRENSVSEEQLQRAGWKHYFNTPTVELSPHYQAYLWADFLWGYKQTGYPLFLDRAKQAIQTTMEGYPDKWRWTMGLQEERARMLLPLAWLVRVEDTPEHRGWLRRIADDLLANQDPCGAIGEVLGKAENGLIVPPRTHEAFGTTEAPIIQTNDDKACDLLYTCNFALLGLREAVSAGESQYQEAENKLANFLCRIQIRSEAHAELDGGWYRGFDFKRWEYWGSNADSGWGVWAIETGWSQSWIVTALSLRELKTSLWDLTASTPISQSAEALIREMIGDAAMVPDDEKTAHLAVGKPVVSSTAYTAPFSGGGTNAITDGRMGKPDLAHPAWQGYEGVDLEGTVYLGTPAPIKHLQTQYLQSAAQGAFFPSLVEYAVSDDGTGFRVVGTVANDVPPAAGDPAVKAFSMDLPEGTNARYVKVHAKNLGQTPEGLPAAGKPALLCVDEFAIQ